MNLWVAMTWATALVAAGCQSARPDSSPREVAPADAATSHVILEPAASGPVGAVVRDALARAGALGRRVVVYVGASWCEPCQRFHRAAEQGELDATFPTLTLLVFDSDRDAKRLAEAGYTSKYIPAFMLPNVDGTSSGQRIQGGVKGEGAVAEIAPRLAELLSR
ncbi:MAG: thioredoxin family protein [Polyangiaceae bacterium]|nr:thioredoxin family protein [Polyangiaceae bacterium]